MVAKVAGGVLGIGLIGTGGIAFIKPEWLGINREIPWTPLSQDKDFSSKSSSYATNTFGDKYKNYLTGLVGTKKSNNDSWWKESFKNLTTDKGVDATRNALGNGFKDNINDAIKPASESNDGNKYLREVCDTIYKTDNSKVKATLTASSTDEYKEADVWKYCSPLGEKPKTISGNSETSKYDGNNAIGKDATDSTKLVSTKGNDKFWEIRDKEFRGKDGYSRIEDTDDAFFTNASYKNKSIKDICEIAYGKESASGTTSEADKPKKEQVIKYCSLEKQ